MNYTVRGTGAPVIFLHGIPAGRRLWDLVIEHLEDRFTAVAPDLPGFGESPPRADGSHDPAHLAEEVASLGRRLGWERWHVVGHDAGATVAVHLAAAHPERTDRLCLMAPPVFPEFRPPWFFRLLRQRGVGDLLAPLVVAMIWHGGIQSIIDRRDERMAEILASFHAPFRGWSGARQLVRRVRWGDPRVVLARTAACLPKIKAPTLILHGRTDGAIPESFSHRAAEVLSDARVAVLETGHFLPLNRPREVAGLLEEFLGGFLGESPRG